MNVYFDGSFTPKIHGGVRLAMAEFMLSYGIVIEANGEHHEMSGAVVAGQGSNGLHEVLAFVEAVLWLDSHEVAPAEVVFIGDDQTVVYGAQCFNAGYGSTAHYDRLIRSVQDLIRRKLCPSSALDRIAPYVSGSRFIKVKGHADCVNNNRCDYLSRAAARKLRDPLFVEASFSSWLKTCFQSWSTALDRTVVSPAPFSKETA